jgi:hypothetical protein
MAAQVAVPSSAVVAGGEEEVAGSKRWKEEGGVA